MQSFFAWSISIAILFYTVLADGMCTSHSSVVGESIWNQLDRALAISGANKVIYQSDVPYTISTAGAYSVGEDLTNTGTANPVITLSNNNAILDLQGHAIIASANANTAIRASTGIIRNGLIIGFPTGLTSTGSMPIVRDTSFINCSTGILTSNGNNIIAEHCTGLACGVFHGHNAASFTSSQLTISNCDITDCTSAAFSYTNAFGAIINNCSVDGAVIGVSCYNSQAILIRDSFFSKVTRNGIQSDGTGNNTQIHIENCRLTGVGINGILLAGNTTLSEIIDTILVNVANNGIDNSASGGGFNVILRSRLTNIAGTGVNDVLLLGNSAVYANYLATVGTAFFGGSAVQNTPGSVTGDTTNFWQNIVDA